MPVNIHHKNMNEVKILTIQRYQYINKQFMNFQTLMIWIAVYIERMIAYEYNYIFY